MGLYLNPDNEKFKKIVSSEIYIDKTGLLNMTNRLFREEKNCIAVSHARRFGKSQAARMIDAYYSRGCCSEELFDGLEISSAADFKEHLNRYNVIHFDISSFTDEYKQTIVSELKRYLYDDLKKEYPDVDYSKTVASVLYQIYESTKTADGAGIKFVIVIDEWDCIVRNFSDSPEIVHEYLQFLHSLFKSNESQAFLGIGYITGILPIKKIENESALNNFIEYTMTDPDKTASYFGFTEEEVGKLCDRYQMPFDSVKEWYNGYVFENLHMYNPDSVCMAMIKHKLRSYWKNTSAFSSVNRFISLNFDGLKESVIKMLNGGRVSVDTETFQNDLSVINSRDDALTALIHLGYLGYDGERKKAYIPNYEVAVAFKSALATGNWTKIADSIQKCEELLWATIEGDSSKVAEFVALAHEAYTSVLKYNDENSLSCAITMAYFTAPAYYNVVRELPSGKGFADIAFIPRSDSGNMPAMIIELKYDKDADSALNQIKEKRYNGKLKGYSDRILLVGINYSKDTKKYECVIENLSELL